MTEPAQQDAGDRPPFLRIQGTYPTNGGRFSTVTLELNVGDDVPLADGDTETVGTTSWFNQLCTDVVAVLRRPPMPPAIVIHGTGAPTVLADRLRHADDCDGSSCGVMPAGPVPAGEDIEHAAPRPATGPAGQTGEF